MLYGVPQNKRSGGSQEAEPLRRTQMADEKKFYKVLVQKVHEYEVFVAVDDADDAEDAALGLIANDFVEASNECDPEATRIQPADAYETANYIFLDEKGNTIETI
jgi:hypothetical protein